MIKPTIRSKLPANLAAASPLARSRPQMTDCATCGQSFDLRKLALAYYHDAQPHEPL